MSGLNHNFGQDMAFSPTGNLSLVSGTQQGQQRVLRRLLTNPGAYIWELTYGAGLGGFVGRPNSGAQVQAIARKQMLLEAAVAASPAPTAAIVATSDGSLTLSITYVDAPTNANLTLSAALT